MHISAPAYPKSGGNQIFFYFAAKQHFFFYFFFPLCCEISRVFGTAGFMEEAKAPRAEEDGSDGLHIGTWEDTF